MKITLRETRRGERTFLAWGDFHGRLLSLRNGDYSYSRKRSTEGINAFPQRWIITNLIVFQHFNIALLVFFFSKRRSNTLLEQKG